MKFLDNVGGWVLDHSWFTLPFAMVFTFIVVFTSLPDFVILDGKHWKCNGAVPDGISSQCVGYVYQGK